MINKIIKMTCGIRHRIAAEVQHFLTMPDYYYLPEGEVIIEKDEIRVLKNECWHPVIRLAGTMNCVLGTIRRYKILKPKEK
jgi:hypothetical protein